MRSELETNLSFNAFDVIVSDHDVALENERNLLILDPDALPFAVQIAADLSVFQDAM